MDLGQASRLLLLGGLLGACALPGEQGLAPPDAPDPGVRAGAAGAGGYLAGLDDASDPDAPAWLALFVAGQRQFSKPDTVAADGLGPTFNLDSCRGCHAAPAIGGSSPGPTPDHPFTENPQYSFWHDNLAASNQLPTFIKGDDAAHPGVSPVREARFKHDPDHPGVTDGGVHDLFTIVGLPGTPAGCTAPVLQQPDFAAALASGNVIFRIPTPTFGAGLIEQIPDHVIEDNRNAQADVKAGFGILGKSNVTMAGRTLTGSTRKIVGAENRNGNDGTIARFGWKAQNKSLLVFSGEAYNVEMGISNELFPTERAEVAACLPAGVPAPNDHSNPQKAGLEVLSDIEKFAGFMRLLAPPQPSADTPGGAASIGRGSAVFDSVGCAYCHTRSLHTEQAPVKALANQEVKLYSDLLVHRMGPALADGITQGQAGPDEFRTAPLWGLGQRTWLLHDGRTNDLVQAIYAHASGVGSGGSEANTIVRRYRRLPTADKTDLLNFLRSL